MATAHPTNPIALLGQTIDFVQASGGHSYPYAARVLAVQVPLPGSGVEWALLLQPVDSDRQEYVPLDCLQFDWPRTSLPVRSIA